MTRRACMVAVILQLILVSALLWMQVLVKTGEVELSIIKPIFKTVSLAVVALGPFGMLSLYASAGFFLLTRNRGIARYILKDIDSNRRNPAFLLVWRELRNKVAAEVAE